MRNRSEKDIQFQNNVLTNDEQKIKSITNELFFSAFHYSGFFFFVIVVQRVMNSLDLFVISMDKLITDSSEFKEFIAVYFFVCLLLIDVLQEIDENHMLSGKFEKSK